MDIEKRRSKLMNLGVHPNEMYLFPASDGRNLLIVRRTGVEKIEKAYGIGYKYLSVTESPYKDKCNVTVVLQGEAIIDGEKVVVQALGSANPDTIPADVSQFYSDIANKRARHKIVLKIADLYQWDVHSEEESVDFRPKKTMDHEKVYKEAHSKIKIG